MLIHASSHLRFLAAALISVASLSAAVSGCGDEIDLARYGYDEEEDDAPADYSVEEEELDDEQGPPVSQTKPTFIPPDLPSSPTHKVAPRTVPTFTAEPAPSP